jgi:hypothetical protein
MHVKYLITSLALCLAVAAPALADPVATAQAAAVQRLQARLPVKVNKVTTLVSVVAVGRMAKYSFQMSVPRTRVPARWHLLQKAKLIKDACGKPAVRKLMKDGAMYSYMYTDVKSRYVAEIRVKDSDCPK